MCLSLSYGHCRRKRHGRLPVQADEELQQRVEELACKANEGTLTAEEQSEYEAYVDAGDIVATLQAVARKTLQAVAG